MTSHGGEELNDIINFGSSTASGAMASKLTQQAARIAARVQQQEVESRNLEKKLLDAEYLSRVCKKCVYSMFWRFFTFDVGANRLTNR